jgi:hypothetical protein
MAGSPRTLATAQVVIKASVIQESLVTFFLFLTTD